MKSGKPHRFTAFGLIICSTVVMLYINTKTINEDKLKDPLLSATIETTTVPETTIYITPATIAKKLPKIKNNQGSTTSTGLTTTTNSATTAVTYAPPVSIYVPQTTALAPTTTRAPTTTIRQQNDNDERDD